MNPAFRKGRNTVTFKIRMIPEGSAGYTPLLKIDLGYWPMLDAPFRLITAQWPLRMNVETEVHDGQLREVPAFSVEGQEHLSASAVERVDGNGIVGEWNTYQFDVDVDFPADAWANGQLLNHDAATRDALVAKMWVDSGRSFNDVV